MPTDVIKPADRTVQQQEVLYCFGATHHVMENGNESGDRK